MTERIDQIVDRVFSEPVPDPNARPPITELIHGLKRGRLSPEHEEFARTCRTCQAFFLSAAKLYGLRSWALRYLDEGEDFPFRSGMERYLVQHPVARFQLELARAHWIFRSLLAGMQVQFATLVPNAMFAAGERAAIPDAQILVPWDEETRLEVYARMTDGRLRCYASSDRPELEGTVIEIAVDTEEPRPPVRIQMTRPDPDRPFVVGEADLGDFPAQTVPLADWVWTVRITVHSPEAGMSDETE